MHYLVVMRASSHRCLALVLGLAAALMMGCAREYAADPEIPAPYPVPATAARTPSEDENVAEPDADEELLDETDPSALTVYDEVLEPHGAWVDDGEWGTVWIPDDEEVGEDFVPYKTAGHWAVDEADAWVWVSDYNWGYIPFHYGRWVWISERGQWAWIPGRVYAPAWVVWRVGEPGYDYVGWAPMAPTWCWYRGWATVCHGYTPLAFWFVPSMYIFHTHWHRHVVPPHHVHVVARRTHVLHRHHRRPASRPNHHRVATARARYRPASPTFAEARVSKRVAPKATGGERRPRTTTPPRRDRTQRLKRPRRNPTLRTPGRSRPPRTTTQPRPRKRVTPPPRSKSQRKKTTRPRPRKKTAPPKRRTPRNRKPKRR